MHFNSLVLYKTSGDEKRFLAFKLVVIKYMLRDTKGNVDFAESGHNQYTGHHFSEIVSPPQSTEKPHKKVCYVH